MMKLAVLAAALGGALLPGTLVAYAQSNELKVLAFNVLHGGVSPEVSVISASGADIIGVQEGDGQAATIAASLGFHHYKLPGGPPGYVADVITRFEITQTYNHGVRIDMGPLGDGYVFSVHLAAYPYEPYRLRADLAPSSGSSYINTGSAAGDAAVAIAGANATRGSQLAAVMNEIAANVPGGASVFLVGDFNEPSHLDWTPEAGPDGAGLHTHAVAWPASTNVANAGFTDSYRELFPDETTKLGYTWTTSFNSPEIHDRIDFVYYRGGDLTATSSQLFGNLGSAGGVSSDVTFSNYPSDHRAVLTTFTLVPEPSAWVIAVLGVSAFAALRGRRGH